MTVEAQRPMKYKSYQYTTVQKQNGKVVTR